VFWNFKQRENPYSVKLGIQIRIKSFRRKTQDGRLVIINDDLYTTHIYNFYLAAIPEKLQSAASIIEEMSGEGVPENYSTNSINEANDI
jgi:hypothetical protein